MKISCVFARRRMARLTALGAELSEDHRLHSHLQTCEQCAVEWETLKRLAHELPSALAVAEPSPEFVAETLRQIREQHRPATAHPLLPMPAAIALATILVFLAWWALRPASEGSTDSERLVAVPTTEPPKPSEPVQPRIAQDDPAPATERVVEDRSSERRLAPTKRKRSVRVAQSKPEAAAERDDSSPDEAVVQTVPIPWQDWGDWYAEAGAYAHAADAYARAYETEQDSGLAYATGYAAETAGDVYQAITYYSQYLTQAEGS